jgi:3-oxoacyl-[acyl-carrier protein] reductase
VFGITVNAIAPGATLTERTRQELPDYAGSWGALLPSGRVGTPEDIAAAALFLASDAAGQITGTTLEVDGGWTSLGIEPDA